MATIITLDPIQDITSAESLQFSLLEALTSEEIELDASNVERITTPCFQILLAAAKTAEQNKHTIRYTNLSEAFISAAAELGLTDYFKGDANNE